MRWIETSFEHLVKLADPTGNGLITSSEMPSDTPPWMRPAQPITIRGKYFPSMTTAARALGVSTTRLRKAVKMGVADNLRPRGYWLVRDEEFATLIDAAVKFNTTTASIRKEATYKDYVDPIADPY